MKVEELIEEVQGYTMVQTASCLGQDSRLDIVFIGPDGTRFTPVADSDKLDSWEQGYATRVEIALELIN